MPRPNSVTSTPSPHATRDLQWQRLLAELQAYSEEQQELWGDIDDTAVARYLAGECNDEELKQIEQAIAEYPQLRESIELVHQIMDDIEPAA